MVDTLKLADQNWIPWLFLLWFFITYIAVSFRSSARHGAMMFAWVFFGLQMLNFALNRTVTEDMPLEQKIAIRQLAGEGLFTFLIMSIAAYHFNNLKRALYIALVGFACLHACILFYDNMTLPEANLVQKGLLGNRSLGASFLSVMVFLVPWPLAALFSVAILTAKSAISAAALAIGSLGYVFSRLMRNRPILAMKVGLFIICCSIVTLPLVDSDAFTRIERYDFWRMFLQSFLKLGDDETTLFGLGGGSFRYYGPLWQMASGLKTDQNFWIFAHNDWLELFIEFGLVGLGLAVVVYSIALGRAFKTPWLFGSGIAYGTVMMGNYPWQIAMTSVLGLWILMTCLGNLKP